MSTQLANCKPHDVADAESTCCSVRYSPRIDIWEAEDELVLQADLPGVAPEDLAVHSETHELTIHGKVAPRYDSLTLLCGEYGIGDFQRSFHIGEAIDAGGISAELQDGVLTLHLPKTEEVKPRRVDVRSV